MREFLENDIVHLIILLITMTIMILSFKLKNCILLNKFIPVYKYDFLTGLELRQDFDKKITKLMKEATPFYISLIDINDLHSINKQLGYRAGDEVIKEVANDISKLLKKIKNLNIYRIGGDEFIVISQDDINHQLDQLAKASYATAYFNGDKDYNALFDEIDQAVMLVKKQKIIKGEFQDRRQH
ncbi:diguanylate cyclase domain-containing protein [Thiosulfativibrio zosterae]|uniref:GGDEF domain-containing protein n=1 Tax=Thiosulfativibrio zosterae TaxID=2675053 RepID=A0A6F8PMC6_9GAMM|nr:diguanylate cyclase [Thiosulfativibrio zosterae]BBP43245.1 hypothetical protein THMIRHAT_09910 [Thiosulfativibrio zosterae]